MRISIIIGLALWAQLSPPNKAGVAMGHLHYLVNDVEANKKFWIGLGATPEKLGATDVMRLPDVLIFLTKGESTGGTEGAVLNHIAFKVPNLAEALAKFESAGVRVERGQGTYRAVLANVFTPEGERVDESAQPSVPWVKRDPSA